MTTLQDTVRPASQSREWKAIVVLILMIPVLWSPVLAMRFVVFQPFNIPSGSMAPTLVVGDYVLAEKYAYGWGRYSFPFELPWISGRLGASDPDYGDIVVFRSPKDTSVDYIKRVVGLPGDRIQMRQGQLMLNERPVTHLPVKEVVAGLACGTDAGAKIKRWREILPNGASYVTYDCIDNGYLDNTNIYTVPPGHLFVLGDNRDNSTDSRMMSAMGFIPMDNLVGKVSRIFWSIDSRGQLRPDRMGKVY